MERFFSLTLRPQNFRWRRHSNSSCMNSHVARPFSCPVIVATNLFFSCNAKTVPQASHLLMNAPACNFQGSFLENICLTVSTSTILWFSKRFLWAHQVTFPTDPLAFSAALTFHAHRWWNSKSLVCCSCLLLLHAHAVPTTELVCPGAKAL